MRGGVSGTLALIALRYAQERKGMRVCCQLPFRKCRHPSVPPQVGLRWLDGADFFVEKILISFSCPVVHSTSFKYIWRFNVFDMDLSVSVHISLSFSLPPSLPLSMSVRLCVRSLTVRPWVALTKPWCLCNIVARSRLADFAVPVQRLNNVLLETL